MACLTPILNLENCLGALPHWFTVTTEAVVRFGYGLTLLRRNPTRILPAGCLDLNLDTMNARQKQMPLIGVALEGESRSAEL